LEETASRTPGLPITDIPDYVEQLKSLMGVCLVPQNEHHPLYGSLEAYERWLSRLLVNTVPPPPNVIQLASDAYSVVAFRDDWSSDPRVLRYLRSKLNSPDHVEGILFEFRSALHFKSLNGRAQWLPNLNSPGELDIRVQGPGDSRVLVECTRRNRNNHRANDLRLLTKHVCSSLRNKLKSISDRGSVTDPVVIAVLIPESIRWSDIQKTERDNVVRSIRDNFEGNSNEYNKNVTLCCVVVNNPPTSLSSHTSPTGFELLAAREVLAAPNPMSYLTLPDWFQYWEA
jgi:hypothetical protein